MNTQKLVQKLKFGLIFTIFFAGCSEVGYDPATLKEAKSPEFYYESDDTLSYLNDYRKGSGLFALKFNKTLSIASQNHAQYSVLNSHMGHDEDNSNQNFTGITPAKRANFVGYNASYVLENISYRGDFKDSIDGLFSAIYHRFGFMDFGVDEVGFGNFGDEKFSSYTFLMGNSIANEFCTNGRSDSGSGKFYTKFCKNEEIKIKDSRFEKFFDFGIDIVKFPHKTPVMPYFSGETPDPFPECKITANPVSVEFSKAFKDIQMLNFEIYKGDKKLENLKIIDSKNDINRKFSPNQFAVFSKDVFDFNAEYSAVFTYTDRGKEKSLTWSFKTKTPKFLYFDAKNGDVLSLKSDVEYEIFFRPKDCNDLLSSYSFKTSSAMKKQIKQSGINTLRVKLSGMKGDLLSIKTSGGDEVKLVLSDSSIGAKSELQSYLIKSAIIVLLAIAVFVILAIRLRR